MANITSKITFDFWFRNLKIPLRRPILLTLEICAIKLQLHYVKNCAKSCLGNSITITLHQKLRHQKLRLKLFPNMLCNRSLRELGSYILAISLGQKNRRTKVPRIFPIFVPNFAPNFAPNFPRIFWGVSVLHFVGNGDQKKFTKNPRRFSM